MAPLPDDTVKQSFMDQPLEEKGAKLVKGCGTTDPASAWLLLTLNNMETSLASKPSVAAIESDLSILASAIDLASIFSQFLEPLFTNSFDQKIVKVLESICSKVGINNGSNIGACLSQVHSAWNVLSSVHLYQRQFPRFTSSSYKESSSVLSKSSPHEKLMALYSGSFSKNTENDCSMITTNPVLSQLRILPANPLYMILESLSMVASTQLFNCTLTSSNQRLKVSSEHRLGFISHNYVKSAGALFAAYTGTIGYSTKQPPVKKTKTNDLISGLWERLLNDLHFSYFRPLSTRFGIPPQNLSVLFRATSLYIFLGISVASRSGAIIEAANALKPYLDTVADRLVESEMPQKSEFTLLVKSGGARRFSWSKVSDDCSDETCRSKRSLSDSSPPPVDETTPETTQKNADRKFKPLNFPQLLATEIKSLPDWLCLTSSRILRSIQSVISVLYGQPLIPPEDSIRLYTLLCIFEVNPNICHTLDKSDRNAEEKIKMLLKFAEEGSAILESHIGGSSFFNLTSGKSSELKISSDRRAKTIALVYNLRHAKDPSDHGICVTNDLNILAGMIRVLGDITLQYAGEMGYPAAASRVIIPPDNDSSCPDFIKLDSLAEAKFFEYVRIKCNQFERIIPIHGDELNSMSDQLQSLITTCKELEQINHKSTSRQNVLEKQYVNCVEGPVARHTNQIKLLMNRFDNLDSELRKLSGSSSTQFSCLSNQINDVRKSFEKQTVVVVDRSSSNEATPRETSMVASEPVSLDALACADQSTEDHSATSNPDLAWRVQRELVQRDLDSMLSSVRREVKDELKLEIQQLQPNVEELVNSILTTELDNIHRKVFTRLERQIRTISADLKVQAFHVISELRDGQKQALENALLNLGGLTEAVQTILEAPPERHSNTDTEISTAIKDLISATEDKVKRLVDFVDDRCARVSTSSQEKQGLQACLLDFEERVRKLEAEVERIMELERAVMKNAEHMRALENQYSEVTKTIRTEADESMSQFRKRVKQNYVAEMMGRIESLELELNRIARILALRTFPQSPSSSVDHPPHNSERAKKEIEDKINRIANAVQWDLNDLRHHSEAQGRVASSEVESLRLELRRLQKERADMADAFRLQIVMLENSVAVLQAEKKQQQDSLDRLQGMVTHLMEDKPMTRLYSGSGWYRTHYDSPPGDATPILHKNHLGSPTRRNVFPIKSIR